MKPSTFLMQSLLINFNGDGKKQNSNNPKNFKNRFINEGHISNLIYYSHKL